MFCPNCGHDISKNAAFCGQCGFRIELAASEPQPARRRGVIALVVYFSIAIIIGGVALYFLFRPEADNSSTESQPEAAADSSDHTAVAIATTTPEPTVTNADVVVAGAAASATVTSIPTAIDITPDTPTPSPTPQSTNTPLPTATLAPTHTPSPTLDPGPETFEIGQSMNGRPIEAFRIGNGPLNIIFIGGLHAGFAPGTVSLAQQSAAYFEQNPTVIPPNQTVYIIFSANPDSPNAPGELNGRLNANNVDLNRNWDCDWVADARWRGNVVPGSGGAEPFSEQETQLLRDFILEKQPVAVIFWEARAENGLVSPGSCGVRSQASESLATIYGTNAGYRISDFESLTNQVLNGDGTNWLDQQGIPAIAVLLPQYNGMDWQSNREGILAVLQQYVE